MSPSYPLKLLYFYHNRNIEGQVTSRRLTSTPDLSFCYRTRHHLVLRRGKYAVEALYERPLSSLYRKTGGHRPPAELDLRTGSMPWNQGLLLILTPDGRKRREVGAGVKVCRR